MFLLAIGCSHEVAHGSLRLFLCEENTGADVDSSVAAFLSKQAGYDCIGVTIKLFQNEAVVTGHYARIEMQDGRPLSAARIWQQIP